MAIVQRNVIIFMACECVDYITAIIRVSGSSQGYAPGGVISNISMGCREDKQ